MSDNFVASAFTMVNLEKNQIILIICKEDNNKMLIGIIHSFLTRSINIIMESCYKWKHIVFMGHLRRQNENQ